MKKKVTEKKRTNSVLPFLFKSLSEFPMRILIVTPSYFPIVGGSETLTRILSMKLSQAGIQTDIMTYNMVKKWKPFWKEKLSREGQTTVFKEPALNPFPGLPNPLSNFLGINVLPKPAFLQKYKDYDILHFVGEADLSFPIFSLFVKKPKLMQCVGIFRKGGICKYYNEERAFIGKTFKKMFHHVADLFVISDIEERRLLQDLAVPREKIAIVPIGVDVGIFKPGCSKRERNTLLFVGRLDRVKGLHILLEALQYLKIPVKLVIIGPSFDPSYSREIEAKSQEVNRRGIHNVIFMGEMVSTDIVSWYQNATILVCPYVYETYSNVVLEALACGTPVLSTGTHLIEDRNDGILLTKKDPLELANAIDNALTDQELLTEFGKAGRRVIEEFFSWDAIINDFTKLYESMLNDSRK